MDSVSCVVELTNKVMNLEWSKHPKEPKRQVAQTFHETLLELVFKEKLIPCLCQMTTKCPFFCPQKRSHTQKLRDFLEKASAQAHFESLRAVALPIQTGFLRCLLFQADDVTSRWWWWSVGAVLLLPYDEKSVRGELCSIGIICLVLYRCGCTVIVSVSSVVF